MKVAIVTPTYNEADNIERLINEIYKVVTKINGVNFTLIVADDNSPDGTAELAEKIGAKHADKNFSLRILDRKKKDGIGNAYLNAFNILLKEDFNFIIQMDADLSHDPKYIKDFVKLAKEGKDFVISSRYIKGGGLVNWGLHRKLLSWGGNMYTRTLLGGKVTDYTGGYNMFSINLLSKLSNLGIGATGYGFFIELKYQALKYSKSFAQIPIVFIDREHGKSKIPKNTIFVNLLLVPRLKFLKTSKKLSSVYSRLG